MRENLYIIDYSITEYDGSVFDGIDKYDSLKEAMRRVNNLLLDTQVSNIKIVINWC